MDETPTSEVPKIKDWAAGGYQATFEPDTKEGMDYLKGIPGDCARVFFEYAKASGSALFVTYQKNKFVVKYNSDYTWSIEKAT